MVGRNDLTYAQVEALLWDMEAARAQYDDKALEAARFVADLAQSRGWFALERRASLVTADFATRNGELAAASVTAQEVVTWAVQHQDVYLQARGAFIRSMIANAIGDSAVTRIEGLHGVRLLAEDAPVAIRIDHLLMAAVGHGVGTPEGDRWYAEVLELAQAANDPSAAMVIYNNQAWHWYLVGDGPRALRHVEEVRSLAARTGEVLTAVVIDTIARVQILCADFDGALQTVAPVIVDQPEVAMGEVSSRVDCLLAAASVHRRREEFTRAAELIDTAEEEAVRLKLLRSQAEVHEERSVWHAAQGDFDAAFAEYVLFHAEASRVRSEDAERHAHLVRAAYEVEQAAQDATRFRELAYRDPLTDMHNRRFLDEELSRMCSAAHRDGSALTAAIIDVDHFKRVNDELSHECGDEVLRALGRILEAASGPEAVLGRLGGEEFALLLAGVVWDEAVRVCERVRRAVQDHDWAPITGKVPVTVSIGVSTAPTGVTSPGALMADADRNLYAAKRSGRNRVMADPER